MENDHDVMPVVIKTYLTQNNIETLRAKEQQMKAATLLKDKDYDLACSAAYKGQCEAAII